MLKKLTNKKGFTLMEMLIVVAIIAVLVAIAIPTFTSALNKAKAGTDLANIRSGYASAQLEVMTGNTATVYYLNNDGSVSDTASGSYTTKGESKYADTTATVGGQFGVAANAADKKVAWGKDKHIKYTVTDGTISAIVEVS